MSTPSFCLNAQMFRFCNSLPVDLGFASSIPITALGLSDVNDKQKSENLTMKKLRATLLMLTLLLIMSANTAASSITQGAAILYVDQQAAGEDDGSSWANAFNDLADALGVAEAGAEIWVAAGIYTPANASSSFDLGVGIALYGGFNGTETERDARDWTANQTILSGDVDGNDLAEIPTLPNQIVGDNAGPILIADAAGEGARIDGFTVTAGAAANGAGIRLSNGTGMVVENIDFIGNFAGSNNEGIVDIDNASPRLNQVRFSNNEAQRGGAMRIRGSDSAPVLIRLHFENNKALNNGGALYMPSNEGQAIPSATLINATFLGNQASEGGAITCDGCILHITNGLFVGNVATSSGGMMQNVNDGNVTLTNVTVWSNRPTNNFGAIAHFNANTTLHNTLFWDNGSNNAIGDFETSVTASHSLVQFRPGGVDGNLNGSDPANTPQVVRLPNLNSEDFGDLRHLATSPTIGQGSNALLPADEFDINDNGNTTEPLPLDLDGNPRVIGGTVDLGPFEYDELLNLIFRDRFEIDGD